MEADKTTLNDLAIFHMETDQSVFSKLNFARTTDGAAWLEYFLSHPLSDLQKIVDTQQSIQLLQKKLNEWPQQISNGTIMVMEKFYEYQLSDIPSGGGIQMFLYQMMNASDLSLVKYSVKHFVDFVQGMDETLQLFTDEKLPNILKEIVEEAQKILQNDMLQKILAKDKKYKLSVSEMLQFGSFLRNRFKHSAKDLMSLHGKLDAYYSMAMAMQNCGLCFPIIQKTDKPYIEVKGLFHLLLPTPTAYDFDLNQQTNFLFLTGANMAGKSTFIKAVGVSTYLAHCGMGVPAQEMKMSLMDGLLSNIQVADNIVKGESYFFNEVQRIKNTILKINDGRNWLILIDELFKGTNVQDAMKCSLTVIQGLLKMRNSLFILSTHLYEIAEDLKSNSNILFRFFETNVREEQLEFSYALKEGVSNDRLGYLILQREKVVELLNQLS